MGEVWKTIPECPRLEISNLGRIKSIKYRYTNKEKILTLSKSKNGYFSKYLKPIKKNF